MSSIPCTASTSVALRIADSRSPSLESFPSGRCTSRPGMSSSGTASSTTSTSGPPIIHRMKTNSRKNGRSDIAAMVVEVISSRTDSSSRIWAINDPVDFDRAPFLIRRAWANTRSEIRRSARFPTTSEICTLSMRMMNSNTMAIITPPNSTHSVASDWDGTTLSYTCMEKTMPESASTLATSATSIMSL